MPLNERFVPRRSPQAPGEKGTPFAQANGLGRFFVVRELMTSEWQLKQEYAKDEKRKLELAVTLAIRTQYWGADDGGQWYPVTYTVANLAFADTRGQYVRPPRRARDDPDARIENNWGYLENNGTGQAWNV